MDDIDAAVEDAEYVRAMRDVVPHPTKDWEWMAAPELEKYIEQNKSKNPKAYRLETIVESTLGLYLFLKFAKDNGSNALCNFVLTIASFKQATEYSLLSEARHIVQEYLVDGSKGVNDYFAAEWPARVSTSSESHPFDEPAGSLTRGGSNAIKISGDRVARLVAAFSERKSSLSMISPLSSHRMSSPSPSSSQRKPSTLILSPDKSMFDTIESAVFEMLKETHWSAFMESEEWTRYHQFMAMQGQIEKDGMQENVDFFVLRVVGRGGFGQVNACKKATTGKLYAMKQMSKKRIKMKRCEPFIVSERAFLTRVHSPYVVNLAYAFASATDVYLVLDLMIGGDLSFHIKARGRFSLAEAKYYTARTLLGIAALHDLGIVHRDLKPENILMDVHGRTRISDFGLAAEVPAEGLLKCCGTRGYWAPEMIARPKVPYFLAADWFSLGVCLYELLTGNNPFFLGAEQLLQNSPEYDRSQFEAAVDRATLEVEPDLGAVDPVNNIQGENGAGPGARRSSLLGHGRRASCDNNQCKVEAKQPDEERSSAGGSARRMSRRISAARSTAAVSPAVCAAQAKDLLQRLLCKDPARRIGGTESDSATGNGNGTGIGSKGYAEIMAHPWFADIDWSALNSMPPPWCPEQEINMKAQSEIGEFSDARETNALQLDGADQAHYADWTFVSPRAFQQEVVDFLRYEELQGPIRPAADSACCTVS